MCKFCVWVLDLLICVNLCVNFVWVFILSNSFVKFIGGSSCLIWLFRWSNDGGFFCFFR